MLKILIVFVCWSLGNELSSGGIGARIEVDQYAKDMIELKKLVNQFYPYPAAPQPKILAPGGFYEQDWFNNFLQLIGPGIIDGVTHHIYNLGPGLSFLSLRPHLCFIMFDDLHCFLGRSCKGFDRKSSGSILSGE